jgi:hypothetical protein
MDPFMKSGKTPINQNFNKGNARAAQAGWQRKKRLMSL